MSKTNQGCKSRPGVSWQMQMDGSFLFEWQRQDLELKDHFLKARQPGTSIGCFITGAALST